MRGSRLALGVCLFVLSTGFAFGAGARKTKSRRSQATTSDGRSGASHANRVGKEMVAVGEIGLIDILHFGVGGEFGYYLEPDKIAEAAFMRADFSFLGYQSTITFLTARYKWFVGNSFYLQFGGGLRMLNAVDDYLFSEEETSEFNATHLVGEFGLGNRWQFDSFTIGCDWVGYAQPLVQISSSESFTGDVSDESKDTERSSFESRSDDGNLMNVRFHLGVSF